jgi:flavin reductase (DIM6/NTAB) family NADH-FMN oxidoreductase RutF
MTDVSMENLTALQKYWLVTGSVGPRPVALVTSLSKAGLCNAAPFSAFNYMGEDPPLMVMAVDRYGTESHRLGERKDTLVNVVERGEFVVNMVDEALGARMIQCAIDYPKHVSEPEAIGLAVAQSNLVGVPRLSDAPIAWECKLFKTFDFSESRTIVFGEIVSMHFRDELFDASAMRVRIDKFEPLGRLGGPNYCRTTERMRMPVPTFLPSQGVPRN